MKESQIGREVKLTLFADDVMLYIENPKNATRKLLDIKELDTKLIHRNLLHFYTPLIKYQREKLRKQSHLPLCERE